MTHSRLVNLLTLLLVAAVCWGIVLACSGCAVGRNDQTGAIVLGVEAGKLVETTSQAINAATSSALSALGIPAGGAGALGLLASILWRNGAVAKARKEGEDKGWREREDAAKVQHPLPAPSPSPAGGVG